MVSAKLSAPKGILFGPRVKETKRSTVVSERSIGVADHQDGLFTAGRASLSGAIWRRLRDADLSCRTTYRADTVEPDLRRPAEARADDGDAWNTRAVRWKLEQFGFSSNSEEGFISLFLRDSVRKTGTTLLELLQQYWDLAGAFPRTAPHRATGNDVTQPTSHDPDRVLLASTRRPRNRLGKKCLNGHIDWLCRGRARGCRSARSFD